MSLIQSLSTCPIGVVVGHHPTPGSVTDRPEVWVQRVHAGREAREVFSVKFSGTALNAHVTTVFVQCSVR